MSLPITIRLSSALCLLASGCAAAPRPVAEASGEILLDGQPVENGIISFISETREKDMGGAAITKGRYHLYAQSELPPGKYRVEIRWAKATGEKVKEPVYGHSPDIFAEAVPTKYNSESVLTAELANGPNEVNFKLEK